MKLHLSNPIGQNTVTAYGSGYVDINGKRHLCNLIVSPQRLETQWTLGPDNQIDAAAIQALASFESEIVLIGTGSAQHFPNPASLRPLVEAGIGFEVMSTPAACRTYNILVGEDRRVAAGLIL